MSLEILIPYLIGAVVVIALARIGIRIPGMAAPAKPASTPPPPQPPGLPTGPAAVISGVAHTIASDVQQAAQSPWLGVLLQLVQSRVGVNTQLAPHDAEALALVRSLLLGPDATPTAGVAPQPAGPIPAAAVAGAAK
jgi:hypothetical protein